jgi:hypothetical protein
VEVHGLRRRAQRLVLAGQAVEGDDIEDAATVLSGAARWRIVSSRRDSWSTDAERT